MDDIIDTMKSLFKFVGALVLGAVVLSGSAADGNAFSLLCAEFAKYYKAITGAEAPADAVSFAIDPRVSKSGKDAYAIKSSARGVTITGSNERSTWYGLYDLLVRRGGCHWFWDCDVVPKKATIDLSGLDVVEEAQFEYRGLRYQRRHW